MNASLKNIDDVVGLDLLKARKLAKRLGYTIRIMEEDMAYSCEYRPNRLNVSVVDGKINELFSVG